MFHYGDGPTTERVVSPNMVGSFLRTTPHAAEHGLTHALGSSTPLHAMDSWALFRYFKVETSAAEVRTFIHKELFRKETKKKQAGDKKGQETGIIRSFRPTTETE